jgi:hypothetical protein
MRLLEPLLFHSQRRIGRAPPGQRKLTKESAESHVFEGPRVQMLLKKARFA